MTISKVLLVIAIILFVCAAIGITPGNISFTAAGLACVAGALLADRWTSNA